MNENRVYMLNVATGSAVGPWWTQVTKIAELKAKGFVVVPFDEYKRQIELWQKELNANKEA